MSEQPDPIAMGDQVLENMKNVARVMGGYKEALRHKGFAEPQAFTIVRDWHWAYTVRDFGLSGDTPPPETP